MTPPTASRRAPAVGAFFDMDKTLLAENSGAAYLRHRYEIGEIDRLDLLRGVGTYLRYKLGLLDIASWTRKVMLELRGRSESELEADALRWAEESVVPSIYPDAAALVRHHLEQGHVVAIVSGATRFVVAPVARRLGIRHMIYTHLEVERGRFTGRVVEPVCFEEGKIYWLQQFIEQQGVALAKSWFYTDSITDLPLLELVGHPVVTNPDPLLYWTALRRNWPVRLFEPPALGAGEPPARPRVRAP